MSYVPRREHGQKLKKERFAWRFRIYSLSMAGTWAVYPFVSQSLNNLAAWVKPLALCLSITSVILGLSVLALSYLEVFWFHEIPEGSARKRVFYWVALPILYSSLWLYWFSVGPVYVFFAVSFANVI